MKIAVTGATGGLGRSLVEYLLAKNIEVVALGRNKDAGEDLKQQGADFLSGEITDIHYLQKAFEGCNIVVHSAGLASPWGKWDAFYNANVKGTEAVLSAMRSQKIPKLIYISTPSLYFSGEPFTNRLESDPLPEQKTFYGKSKLMADELVLSEVKVYGLNAVLLRPRAIFGKYDSAIIPRMLRLMKKGFFPLPNGGSALVDVTAVENIIYAIWLVIESDKYFAGEVFNISNGEPLSVKDLTAKIAAALKLNVKFVPIPKCLLQAVAAVFEFYADTISGKEPMVSKYSIDSIGTTQTLSLEKARQVLGYKPIISTGEAIQKYADSILKNSR